MIEDRAKVDTFTSFVRDVEERLRHSLIPSVGLDAATEATAEALAYGWENWDRLRHMDNPAGYLYRVARTKARPVRNRMHSTSPCRAWSAEGSAATVREATDGRLAGSWLGVASERGG
jgi:predicted RNA polymerase sigma factor